MSVTYINMNYNVYVKYKCILSKFHSMVIVAYKRTCNIMLKVCEFSVPLSNNASGCFTSIQKAQTHTLTWICSHISDGKNAIDNIKISF